MTDSINLPNPVPDSDYATFTDDEDSGTIYVVRRCPHCQRYIKTGKVFVNGLGHTKLRGWRCSIHGAVRPWYDWI
jgi:hypothetical protein